MPRLVLLMDTLQPLDWVDLCLEVSSWKLETKKCSTRVVIVFNVQYFKLNIFFHFFFLSKFFLRLVSS